MVQPNAYSNNGQYGGEFLEHNIRATRDSFPMPDDQTLKEIELLGLFESRYPYENPLWCLGSILDSLNKVACIEPPTDEKGEMESSRFGISYSKIFLSKMSDKEFSNSMRAAGTEYDIALIDALYKGLVIGKVPDYVNDAFEVVFQLIGARKVRDERDDDQSDGCIIWQGEYMGQTVYLEQRYSLRSNFNNLMMLSACAMNERSGQAAINDLNKAKIDKLKAVGMRDQEIIEGEASSEIRHDNAEGIVELAHQIRL